MLPMRRLLAAQRRTFATTLPPRMAAILRHDYEALDASAPAIMGNLEASEGPFIWHKHGSFLEHLRDVWMMLANWEQPESWCRLGLLHSAYSNSFVSMRLFDAEKDRDAVRALAGREAEALIYKFCVIDRQALEDVVLDEGRIRSEGYESRHIRTGDAVTVSGAEAAAFVTETIADIMDQSFSWQSDLERGHCAALWPGPYAPTLRMSRASRLARALGDSERGLSPRLPPVFDGCGATLGEEDEAAARDAYWSVVSADPAKAPGGPELDALADAALLNPFVAEPRVLSAQIHLQRGDWADATREATAGLDLFCAWATQWDKRMPLHAWVAWTRCLAFQAQERAWPATHGGLESLGAVEDAQQARALNTDRHAPSSS